MGNVLSSDTFYNADATFNDAWKKMGILGIEMESAGLYLNAINAGKKHLASSQLVTIFYVMKQVQKKDKHHSLK